MSSLSVALKDHLFRELNHLILKSLDENITQENKTQAEIVWNFKQNFLQFLKPIPMGTNEDLKFRNKLRKYSLYYAPLLSLFHGKENAPLALWHDLLRHPRSQEKNYEICVPILYEKAKEIWFHPNRVWLEYTLQTKIQDNIRQYSGFSLTAAGLLGALSPSMLTIGLSIFTIFSVAFSEPSDRRSVGRTLIDIGKNTLIFSLVNRMLFPLILIVLVNQNLPLPFAECLQFAGILSLKFLMELRCAQNCSRFERMQETSQINASYPKLKQQVLRNTFSPIVFPMAWSFGTSLGLFLPEESHLLRAFVRFCDFHHILNTLYLMFKLKTSSCKTSVPDRIYLALFGFGGLHTLRLKWKNQSSCLDIQYDNLFGVQVLSLPSSRSNSSTYCHEFSGLLWTSTQASTLMTRTFTADSLRHGDQLFSGALNPDHSSTSVIPWREKVSPIVHFCEVVAPELCQPSSLSHFRGIIPGVRLNAWKDSTLIASQPFPEILSLQSKIETIRALPFPLFFAYQSYRLAKEVKSDSHANPPIPL